MKIIILRSSFQSDDFVKSEYAELLDMLKQQCDANFEILNEEMIGDLNSLVVPDYVMVATGGVENLFKMIFSKFFGEKSEKGITLIADGRNNSLAASLEILTYLGQQGVDGRIVHGTNEEIVNDIIGNSIKPATGNLFLKSRIGLFGQPSDWLIASGVDYDFIREKFGIDTVNIDLQRLIDGIKTVPQADAEIVVNDIIKRVKHVGEPSHSDMIEAAKTYLAIKEICKEEKLDAMTIRCFDIVKTCNTTSCLALALLNDEGIVAGCEGDMQTLISMLLVKRLCKEKAFMANPSILTDNTTMFAHCTIPLSMCDDTIIRSHFESSIGVAIQGSMPLTDYTIFKWGGRRLEKYFVAEAKAVENKYSNHFCRTQITLDINMKPYLLKQPIGNHHVIIKGKHAGELKSLVSSL